MSDILDGYLYPDELSTQLRKSPRTLLRWHVLGIGPPRTEIGKTVVYRIADVQAWLAENVERRKQLPRIRRAFSIRPIGRPRRGDGGESAS
jgi:hypothetical protein